MHHGRNGLGCIAGRAIGYLCYEVAGLDERIWRGANSRRGYFGSLRFAKPIVGTSVSGGARLLCVEKVDRGLGGLGANKCQNDCRDQGQYGRMF